jgi:hypothetical protein
MVAALTNERRNEDADGHRTVPDDDLSSRMVVGLGQF